jgi:DNA-binding XRE family transcriptional regulator
MILAVSFVLRTIVRSIPESIPVKRRWLKLNHHSFGRVLKSLRNAKGISQEKLAELSGLDRSYVSLLERGLRQPSLETLFLIGSALDISPSEIVGRVEKDSRAT